MLLVPLMTPSRDVHVRDSPKRVARKSTYLTRKSNENLVPIVPLKYRRAEMFSVSTIRFLMQMRPRKTKAGKNWKRRIPLLPLTWQRQKNNSTNFKWRFECIKNLNKQSCRLKKCRNWVRRCCHQWLPITHKTMLCSPAWQKRSRSLYTCTATP